MGRFSIIFAGESYSLLFKIVMKIIEVVDVARVLGTGHVTICIVWILGKLESFCSILGISLTDQKQEQIKK